MLFRSTDGFIEQIGGNDNLPMNFQQYEQILTELSTVDETDNKVLVLENELSDWRRKNERTDDVLIIGFQII